MQSAARATWFWTGLVVFGFVLDRIAKLVALAFWSQQPFHLAPGIDLTFLLNKGIAFSLPVPTWLFYVIAAPILLFIVARGVRAYRKKEGQVTLALSLLLLGAASNILDRILYDGVVDYLGFGNRSVVNLADGMIVLAVVMLILSGSSKRHERATSVG